VKESSFKDYIENEVYKTLENFIGRDRVTVSEFLKEIRFDFSCSNKIIKFSHTSLFKALLFMKIKCIRSQSQLAKYLEMHKEDALNLGFYLENGNLVVPDQRSISYFLNHILDDELRNLINSLANKIEELSKKFGIIFDVEIIKVEHQKQSDDKKTFRNRKAKKLEELCHFARKNIYPQINIKMHHNSKYKKNFLLDLLVYLGREQTFAHDGLKRFSIERNQESPDSDTLLYHLKKYENKETLNKMFINAFETAWKIFQNSGMFNKRSYDVAIDFTEWFYYGRNAQMVVGKKPERGAKKCYKFATINIVEAGNRFTLLALPVGALDSKVEIIDKLIQYAKGKIKINKIYADRGFFSADIINVFKKHNLTFLMPATQNKRIAKMVNVMSAPSIIKDYEMTEGRVTFNLVIIDDGKGKKSFATNMDVNENESGLANYLFSMYSKRWGIETGYRMKKELRARTTSKNYVIRLFYFLFSTLLYNLWILIDSIISKSLLGKIIENHLVTEKMFATVLFTLVSSDYG